MARNGTGSSQEPFPLGFFGCYEAELAEVAVESRSAGHEFNSILLRRSRASKHATVYFTMFITMASTCMLYVGSSSTLPCTTLVYKERTVASRRGGNLEAWVVYSYLVGHPSYLVLRDKRDRAVLATLEPLSGLVAVLAPVVFTCLCFGSCSVAQTIAPAHGGFLLDTEGLYQVLRSLVRMAHT